MYQRARSFSAILAGAVCLVAPAWGQDFSPPPGMAPPPDMQAPSMPAPPSFTPPSFTPPADPTPPDMPTNPCGPGVTHCESHSSSSSSGFSFGFAPNDNGPPGPGWAPWGPPAPTPGQLVGQWTLGLMDSGASCTVKLFDKSAGFGLRGAWTGVGCPDGFFTASRWRIAGRELQLTDLMGNPIGAFHLVGPDQLEGYRLSDHARLFLSR